MSFKKINSYTWVFDDGKKSLQEKQQLIDEQSICKSNNFLKEKKYRRPKDQKKVYEKFINEVFADRKFISQKDFHHLILQKFNANTSFYRKRMIDLKLITEKNLLIKPYDNSL